ncbi:MAG: pyridoxamine 5'-phosphate oxidase [Bacteroidales bacterium]|nr:pyridoxamine 5'-phosphate oxidase [Bacteroidales bacterium]
MEFSDLRRDFGKYKLTGAGLPTEPVLLLKLWLEEVKNAAVDEFNAMVVSTVGKDGRPSSRVVLLKGITQSGGLVFYTNYLSRKGKELQAKPLACFHFFWPSFERQVRIEGMVNKLREEESESYFNSRPLQSRLSAIVSPQSETIDDLAELEKKRMHLLQGQTEIKRPENWGGYVLKPDYFEFWQGGKYRLHDRISYRLKDACWGIRRLAP